MANFLFSEAHAQETTSTETGTAEGAGEASVGADKMFMDTLLFLALLFAIFYFILIRPQQKKMKAHQEMLKNLKKGDKVITAGGIYGVIHKIDNDNTLTLELAPDTKIKISSGSISEVIVPGTAPKETANDN